MEDHETVSRNISTALEEIWHCHLDRDTEAAQGYVLLDDVSDIPTSPLFPAPDRCVTLDHPVNVTLTVKHSRITLTAREGTATLTVDVSTDPSVRWFLQVTH